MWSGSTNPLPPLPPACPLSGTKRGSSASFDAEMAEAAEDDQEDEDAAEGGLGDELELDAMEPRKLNECIQIHGVNMVTVNKKCQI